MMNDLPLTVRIGSAIYSVYLKDETIQTEAGQDCIGTIKHDVRIIEVDNRCPNNLKANVLLHEIIHGIMDEYDIDVQDEEKVVTLLSNGLSSFLMDNPPVVDWIRERIITNEEIS